MKKLSKHKVNLTDPNIFPSYICRETFQNKTKSAFFLMIPFFAMFHRKKFQKFQDKRLRICSEDAKELEAAKTEGTFHEKLLDRRSKMKADRYCK